jgi:hypothetical protein
MMQRCAFCGSELPVRARFCGNCGRLPGGAPGEWTALPDTLRRGAPPAIMPQGATSDEEDERDAVLPLLLAGGSASSTAGSVPVVQATPQIGGVPMVAGTPSPGDVPGSAAPSLPGQASSFISQAPQQATSLSRVGTAPQAPGIESERLPGPSFHPDHPRHHKRSGRVRHRPPHGSAHAWSLVSLPRWLLITLVCLTIAAGSTGAWIWLSHGHVPESGAPSHAQSPHVGTTQVPSSQATASATPGTATAQGRSVAVLRYSGALVGQMSIFAFSPMCGLQKDSSGQYYAVSVEGTLGGRTYIFDLLVRPYRGPGTYTNAGSDTTENDSSFTKDGTTDVWGSTQGQATIASDGKSGTFDIPYQGMPDSSVHLAAPGPAHVSGSWTCGQAWGTPR